MARPLDRCALTAALLAFAACSAAPELLPTSAIDVVFVGTDELSFRLRRVIEDPLLDFERDTKSEAPLFDAALDLQDHFVELGYPDAEVSYALRREGRPVVTFTIRQGPRVTVTGITFRGAAAIREPELLALWSRTRSGQLGLGEPLFVAADLNALRLSLLELYDARGWLDVTVDGPEIERSAGASRARVAFAIVEGERYRFGAVGIDGDLPLSLDDVGAADLAGKPFDRTTAAQVTMRARAALMHRGHPDPRLDLEVTPDPVAKTVAVQLHGEAGPRATIHAVAIAGNERTAEHVITRHVPIEPGTVYDGQIVEKATSGLYRTGLFRRVEVELQPRDNAGEDVDMLVKVDEVDARELDLLLGYGSYETLRGGVFWTDRNLFGLGQRLQIGTRASIRGEAFTTSWSEPHFLGSDTSLTVGAQVRERQEPSFVDTSRGIDFAFARDLWGPLRARVGYSLMSRDGSDIDPLLSTPGDSRFEIGSAFTELSVDRRDSPLYPGSGHRLALKFEHAGQGVGGNVDLDRATWSSSWYTPLLDGVVLGVSARTGAIWDHDPNGVPLQERFFNGGEGTVRSFRESKLGPLLPSGTPTGGQFANTFNLELRFPIAAALHGAVFADAGNVGTDTGNFGLANLRWAIGAGLRLVLPIGPVRLDYGVNPDPEPDERRSALHFSVGLPF